MLCINYPCGFLVLLISFSSDRKIQFTQKKVIKGISLSFHVHHFQTTNVHWLDVSVVDSMRLSC